ncbi:hypothetical protein TEA_020496 [Camellia sinensis var. sinensis]|uniref:Mitochondrial inner membrane protease ATP23 n=1 Tax=Camellia sinensis var. sinensis TaxID=542762 RepID=A0A4S4D441_CAMSN|nr:hypothetical protein TEA_020496 [Camellia sinensis var. sinensis]
MAAEYDPKRASGDYSSAVNDGVTVEECQDMIRRSLRTPMVEFLREHLENAGCSIGEKFIKAVPCDKEIGGGYLRGQGTFGSRLSLVCPFLLCAAGLEAGVRELGISRKSSIELNGVGKVLKSGCSRRNDCSDAIAVVGCIGRSVTVAIMVCSNHMNFQDEVNQVVVHELIHAYDDCRAANLDWANCAHHACSEQIRAGHLSGDCHYKRELLRGFVKIQGHEQDCVRRRVMKSVIANPYCSEAAAKDAMEAVWDVCYNDTKPFDRAP